ncbi:MAG: large subunit ribosomal protein L23 [Glaciecola sp.]|jgi:large subunit ribosomal protein L23
MKDIIKRPIVTEKMTAEGEKLNRYGFIVDKKANKVEIKKAVEELYNVSVDKVRTMNYMGKKSTRNTTAGLIVGRKPAFKKAIISLQGDDIIDLYASI